MRWTDETRSAPLDIGTWVKPWGEIVMVGCLHGERYYWFAWGGGVSMLPADVVEDRAPASDHQGKKGETS